MPKGFVLAFHSHNVSGTSYETNDHVALDSSLTLVESLGLPVLRLVNVVERLRAKSFASLPDRFVCVSFDDGSDYDWKPVRHPEYGEQEPMARIVGRHRNTFGTSFVIASPEARAEIAEGHPFRLSEDWWREAQATGHFDIGSHGWNHVHPAVSEMREHAALVEAFNNIAGEEQAELQIGTAARYIRAKAGNDAARLFAYPYGQVSDYLADRWLPTQDEIHAAFTTEGRALLEGDDIWRLPRFVCGWHWKTLDDLRALLDD